MMSGFAVPAAPSGPPIAEGVPTPCTICGGSMSPTQPDALHQSPRLVCPYCHREEGLPSDAAEQHRHLRLRLLQLRRARDAVEAPAFAFEQVKQHFPIAIALLTPLGIWQSATFATQLRPGLAGEVALEPCLIAVMPLGLAVGMLVGWLAMSCTFKAKLLPLLRARPPIAQGLAARCRCCGAPLPPVRAPQVTCTHCEAVSLLDAALGANASALLKAEAEELHRRARGAFADPADYKAPSRAFYTAGGIAAAITIAAAEVLVQLVL